MLEESCQLFRGDMVIKQKLETNTSTNCLQNHVCGVVPEPEMTNIGFSATRLNMKLALLLASSQLFTWFVVKWR